MANISLTPQLETFLREKVKSGRYTSSSEVVREALRLLEEREHLREEKLRTLRREIALAREQLDRGESVDGEVVVREMRKRLDINE